MSYGRTIGPSQIANFRAARSVLVATTMSRSWMAAALISVLLASGCTTRRGSLKWAAAGVGASVVGALLLRSQNNTDEETVPVVLGGVGLAFGGGGIAVISGINAIFASPGPVPVEAPPAPVSVAEHEACLEQRRAIQRRANQIIDLRERTRILQTMPACSAVSPPR
jgi:hypothetical protein